jgi:hypothetical protein
MLCRMKYLLLPDSRPIISCDLLYHSYQAWEHRNVMLDNVRDRDINRSQKIFPAYGKQRFFTVFTRAHQYNLNIKIYKVKLYLFLYKYLALRKEVI